VIPKCLERESLVLLSCTMERFRFHLFVPALINVFLQKVFCFRLVPRNIVRILASLQRCQEGTIMSVPSGNA
jgi:hypothetical protein